MLETNVDDCTGEALGFLMEELMKAGALDVSYNSVYMKKNRPGILIRVICQEAQREEMENLIFAHTTTVGIRSYKVERTTLERKLMEVSTDLGPVRVKVCEIAGQKRAYVEYESVAAICRQQGLAFQDTFRRLSSQIEEMDF